MSRRRNRPRRRRRESNDTEVILVCELCQGGGSRHRQGEIIECPECEGTGRPRGTETLDQGD